MKRLSLCYAAKKNLYLMMYLMLILVMNGILEQTVQAQGNVNNVASNVTVQEGDEWGYFKGPQTPPRKWKENSFNDSDWLRGPSGFGYGTPNNKTNLNDMRGSYSTVYARTEFTVNNIYTVTGMTLAVACDGQFIAYLNGIEMLRNDANQTAQSLAEELDVSGFIHELFPHKNVMAVECSNDDINSNEFSFVPSFKVHEDQGGTE